MKSKSSMFILIVVILLVVGGLIYFFVIKKNDSATPSPTTTGLVSTNTGKATGIAVATTGGTTGDQVVALLRNLSVIQLSDAIFQNPTFALLHDISITLPPVTSQGRRNPFSAVGGDNTSQFAPTITTTPPVTPPATIPGPTSGQ